MIKMSKKEYTPSTELVNATQTSVREIIAKYFPDELSATKGIEKMFNPETGNFWAAKGWIIRAMEKHPNYDGNLRIVIDDVTFHRGVNLEMLDNFESAMLYKVDERYLNVFYSLISYAKKGKSIDLATWLSERSKKILEELGISMHKGEKVTKFMGRFAKAIGLDKVVDIDGVKWEEKDYEWEYWYTKFCEATTQITYKGTVNISVNPIDYYTIGMGDNWSTCYTMDESSIGGYRGCHKNAVQSHLLDPSTIVVYVTRKKNPEKKHKCCLFYLGENKLVQGRVYPDCANYVSNSSDVIRHVTQDVIGKLFGVSLWTNCKGTGECGMVIERDSSCLEYPDYLYYDECNVSYVGAKKKNFKRIKVGHEAICPSCGEISNDDESLFCSSCRIVECAICHNKILLEDAYSRDGDWDCYCSEECYKVEYPD